MLSGLTLRPEFRAMADEDHFDLQVPPGPGPSGLRLWGGFARVQGPSGFPTISNRWRAGQISRSLHSLTEGTCAAYYKYQE